MPTTRAEIIISAKNEVGPAAESAANNLKGVTTEVKKGDEAMKGLNLTTAAMAGALVVGLKMIGDAAAREIDRTVKYADEVRDLGRTIGATAEESSKLIQAADDMGISSGTLTMALEAAIKRGVKPTVTGLGQLADQYNAIQDPIERTAFLQDNFGRSGAKLAPLMEQGAAGIKKLGDEAANTGLVLSTESVKAARAYELSVDALKDASDGYFTLLVLEGLPALTKVNEMMADGITLTNQLTIARQNGVLTDREAASVSEAVKYGYFTVGEAAAYVQEKTDDVAASTAAWAERLQALADDVLADRAVRATNAWAARLQGLADDLGAVTAANFTLDDSFENLLAAGLSGTLSKATDTYRSVIAETTPEIDKLTAQLARYEAAQGKTFTVTTEATASIEEYELAQIKAATAAQKLAEYTGDNRQEYLELKIAADSAAEKVAALGGEMGISQTFTADYTRQIQETSGSLAELNAKQEAAEAQLKLTTAQFIYQQAAASGLSDPALTGLAYKLGLVDETSYNVALKVAELTKQYDANGDGAIDAGKNADQYYAALNNLYTQTVATAEGQAQHLGPAVSATKDAMINAAEAAQGYSSDLDSLNKTVTTTIVTNHLDNYSTNGTPTNQTPGYEHGGPSGPGFAGGVTNFVVPPGFGNDSFPMRVSSGEHVTVTPAGAGGQGDLRSVLNALLDQNAMLPGMIGRAVSEAMLQRGRV